MHMYLGDWLRRRAQLTPEQVALIDAEAGMAPITYRSWNDSAGRTANLLRSLDVRKGDRVAVLALNSVEYLEIWFACAKLGAVMQPLNWRLTLPELAGLLDDATPVVLAYGPEYAEAAAQLAARPSSVRHWVAMGGQGDRGAGGEGDKGPPSFRGRPLAERDAYPPDVPPVELSWDDPWVICYTGGTTGLPKGAVLTHGNIGANAVNTVMGWGLTPDDVAILNAPLFHTGGLNVFTAPLVQIGGCSIVCKGFHVGQVFDLIERAGVTLYFGVPTTHIALQQHPRWAQADFSRLKLVLSGGAPCPRPVFEAFWQRGIAFKTGYGLTEAGPNTFCLPAADVRRKPGAVGFPLFYIDVKVVDLSGAECPAGAVGQLLIRGPHVCKGYWGRPEETARAIVDGWLHTGDIGRFDDAGYLHIVDRKKDMIVSGGFNVYPAEVEQALAEHPAVHEAAVIGVPDDDWGEAVRAVVVLRPGQGASAAELIAHCKRRLGSVKAPKAVDFVADLPRSQRGKVLKRALREPHWAGRERRV